MRIEKFNRLVSLLVLTLFAPSVCWSQDNPEELARIPEVFAGKFEVDVPVWPPIARRTKITIDCDMPFSCLFKVGNEAAVRYESKTQPRLLEFARATLAYAKDHPTKVLTPVPEWNEKMLKPMLSDSADIDNCMHLNRREYPGGDIYMCTLKKELWEQPAVLLIGELKVPYPELFFGTTLYPAFKVSSVSEQLH